MKKFASFFNFPNFGGGNLHNGNNNGRNNSNDCDSSSTLKSNEYVCLGNGCFTCERAALQANCENANWKRKTQKSVETFQSIHGGNGSASLSHSLVAEQSSPCNNSNTSSPYVSYQPFSGNTNFSPDSLKRLKSAEIEKSKQLYVYDERLGKKRRHDPWFARHTATSGDALTSSPSIPKRKKASVKKENSSSPGPQRSKRKYLTNSLPNNVSSLMNSSPKSKFKLTSSFEAYSNYSTPTGTSPPSPSPSWSAFNGTGIRSPVSSASSPSESSTSSPMSDTSTSDVIAPFFNDVQDGNESNIDIHSSNGESNVEIVNNNNYDLDFNMTSSSTNNSTDTSIIDITPSDTEESESKQLAKVLRENHTNLDNIMEMIMNSNDNNSNNPGTNIARSFSSNNKDDNDNHFLLNFNSGNNSNPNASSFEFGLLHIDDNDWVTTVLAE